MQSVPLNRQLSTSAFALKRAVFDGKELPPGNAHDFFVVFLHLLNFPQEPKDLFKLMDIKREGRLTGTDPALGKKRWIMETGRHLTEVALLHPQADRIFQKLALHLHEQNWSRYLEFKSVLNKFGIPSQKLAFQRKWQNEPLDLDLYAFDAKHAHHLDDLIRRGKVTGDALEVADALISTTFAATNEEAPHKLLLEAGKILLQAAKVHPEKKEVFRKVNEMRASLGRHPWGGQFDAALARFAPPRVPNISHFRRSVPIMMQAVNGFYHTH